MSFYASYPSTGGGGGVPVYASIGVFPTGSVTGQLGVAADTGNLYEWNGSSWILLASEGAALSLGNLDAQAGTAKGAALTGGVLSMQSASATVPGLVNNTTQTLSGVKTFSSAPNLSSLTASLPLQLDASKNIVSAAIDLSGTEATGILAAARFPALTGDITTASGALATTLATVNSNVGSFGSTSTSVSLTVNGKGLVTAASAASIQIAESQVTNLVTDLAGKQATGNYITALTGDGTATGPGSVALTLATVNGNVGSFGGASSVPSVTVNAKGLVTAASATAVVAPAGTLSGTTLNATVVTSSLTTVGTIGTGTWAGTTVAVLHGGTGVTTVTTAPTATAFAGWDSNKNFSANNLLDGYATTATAAGTTTLTVASTGQQIFTGVTTQTVVLPAVTGLALGTNYYITNLSTGVVTVQSSGANTIQAMASNSQLIVTSIATSGTGTAAWTWIYTSVAATGLPLTNPMTTGGDVIYGGASGVPTRLANGSLNQVLISAGGTSAPTWGRTPTLNQGTLGIFTSSGTFNTSSTSSTSTIYEYEVIGGGGGGGGANGTAAAGGGGGAGGMCRGTFTSVAASTAITITVGAAGTGGTSAGGTGGTGGTSSIGTPVSVSGLGGIGGSGSTSATTGSAVGGAGGSTSGSPGLSQTGAMGETGYAFVTALAGLQGGCGAASYYGGGGVGGSSSGGDGSAGIAFGSGGGGGIFTANAGSAGAAGFVFIRQLTP